MEFLTEFAKFILGKILLFLASIPIIIWWLAPCLLAFVLFRTAIRKRKSAKDFRTAPKSAYLKKGELSQEDKRQLAEKIQESRAANLKKSFAGEAVSKYMAFATVGLILLTILFVLAMVVLRFHRN